MNNSYHFLKKMTIVSLIFAVLSAASLCFAASFPADDAPMQEGMLRKLTEKTDMTEEVSNRDADRTGYLTIPLPDGVGEDNVSVAADDSDQKIKIAISDVPVYFYHRNFFSGDMKNIRNIRYGYENQVAKIELDTMGIFEPDTVFENGNLYLRLREIQEVYKMVAAIDIGHGGSEEGSVAYGITEREISELCAGKLAEEFAKQGIKTYFTHDLDVNADIPARVQVAESVSANVIISIHTNADSRTRVTHGIQVISQEENREKATEIAENLAGELGLSLAPEKEDDGIPELVSASSCPVYFIRLGYITNKAEAEKMATEEFAEKAAETITASLLSMDDDVSGNNAGKNDKRTEK